jgi:hypothetical protein
MCVAVDTTAPLASPVAAVLGESGASVDVVTNASAVPLSATFRAEDAVDPGRAKRSTSKPKQVAQPVSPWSMAMCHDGKRIVWQYHRMTEHGHHGHDG